VAESTGAHRHSVRVRYGECDMQGVVFNAHYLAYFDDALDHLLRSAGWGESQGWEIMLKHLEVTWHGAAKVEDILEIDVSVVRWGNTSFDVQFAGSVGGEARVDCITTYVVVSGAQYESAPIPDELRAALS